MKQSRFFAVLRMTALVLLLTLNSQLSTLLAQEPIGPVSRVVTNELQAISNQLPAVSVVTAYNVGQQGGALYYYWVVAKYGMNVVTQDQPAGNAPQSTPAVITTAPIPLNGTNYVRVCWNTVPNASGYDVLRTTTGGLPNGAANIGVALNTAGNCVNDQGAGLLSYTLNTYNPAKNPASLRWGRFDMPKITPPPQNAPIGQCRLFVNRTTNSFDAVDETGASCFPTPAPPPPGTLCTDLGQSFDYYVSPTGSDTTGAGTAGNPWQSIMKAVDQIPVLVCGKYTIHLAAGTYSQASGGDADGIHIDGRAFAGGGVGGWNVGGATGNPFWPWESAWIEIVGDPTPGLEFTGGDGDSIDNYIIDHASACDGNAAIAISGGNLVLRGLSIRNGGFGLLAHSSQVKVAGVSWQHNCTDIDAGFYSLIYHDKTDTTTGSWCGDAFCWYAEFRKQAQLAKNWAVLLHDSSLQSDETADATASLSASGLNFTCTGACGTSASAIPPSLFENGARISMLGLWNADTTGLTGGIGTTSILNESVFHVDNIYFDNNGYTNCVPNPCGGPMLSAQEASIIDVLHGGSINNVRNGVSIDTGSKVIYQPNFTNVTNTLVVGTPSFGSID